MKKYWFLSLVPLLLIGCDANEDAAAFTVKLSDLNWQVGILIALAYLANSRSHLSALAGPLKAILTKVGFLRVPQKEEENRYESIAKLLAELILLFQGQPELQSKVLEVMSSAEISYGANNSANPDK